MALARYEQPIQDEAGNLITAASFFFEVRREDVAGNPKKPLYSDRAGVTTLANPAPLVDGVVAFHAAAGPFRLRVYGPGYDETWYYKAIGTGAEVDADQLLIPGYLFEFETGTTAPPGDGGILANNADLSLANRLYISDETVAGVDISTRITALLTKRVLLTSTNAGEQVSWQVDNVIDHTTYYELVLSSHVGATSFPAGRVGLQTEGAQGATGANGVINGLDVTLTNASETLVAGYQGKTVLLSRATAMALTATAAATLVAAIGGPFVAVLKNINTGIVTFDPDGAETIDGLAAIALNPGDCVVIFTDGTVWRTLLWVQGVTSLDHGGLGRAITAPGGDRILFYDVSASRFDFLTLTGLTISGTGLGLDAATQAEQESASITTKPVTPGRQQFHPSASKCWGKTTGGGSPSLAASYNITSVTDTGTGNMLVTIATDFSSADYAPVAIALNTAVSSNRFCNIHSQAAGSFGIYCASDSGVDSDPSVGYAWMCFGDQ